MQTKDDFLKLYINHLSTSATIDVIIRLLTTVDSIELRNRINNWLKGIHFIGYLIDTFNYDCDNQLHSNVSQLICDVIKISREQVLNFVENEQEINFSEKSKEITEMVTNSLLQDIER
jgi:hypothetical protein